MNAFSWGTVLCLLALAAPAQAQSAPRAERPYRGLFGGGLGPAQQSLVFNGSVGGGYDDNILLDQPGGTNVNPLVSQSGGLGTANASLSYSVNKGTLSGGLSLGTSTRYYPSQERSFVSGHNAAGGVTFKMGSRATLSAQESVGYQPYSFFTVLPVFSEPLLGQLPQVSLDYVSNDDAYMSFSGNVSLGYQVSRRTAFSAGYSHQQSRTAFADTRFQGQGGQAGIQYTLSQNLRLRLGYGYQTNRYVGRRGIDSHSADVGVDYSKALSFSRRTTLGFSTGTAAVSNGTDTTYRATGSALLNHELGRTWMANASFDRSVQVYDLLLGPIFSDSFGGGVGGLLNRRMQFQTGIRAAIGTVGFGGGGPRDDFDTYLAQAGLGIALSRNLNMNLDYGFYRYRFDGTIVLPIGIAHSVDRQTVRVGLSVWAPVFHKARR